VIARTLRALTSRTLARRFAWILDERVRCRVQAARLRRRRGAYARALASLRAADGGAACPSDRRFAGVDDDFWYWLMRERYAAPGALDDLLPGFPDEAVQVRFTGNAGELMLWQAFNAYRLIRRLAADHGRPVAGSEAVLDFGCGWGRIIRFFQKDVDARRLWGIDVNAEMIALCRRHDRWSRFETVPPEGPTAFADGTFDLVYAFSVFSHFSEPMHARWLDEIRRILRPGGLLIATTRRRDFIEQSLLDRLRRPLSRHPEAIAGRFEDTAGWLAAYDAGQYCYEPLPGMVDWGETCIPRAYVLRHWSPAFHVCEFVDDPGRCTQNVIVARR
jgi:SAM-dependent methyltransferase